MFGRGYKPDGSDGAGRMLSPVARDFAFEDLNSQFKMANVILRG